MKIKQFSVAEKEGETPITENFHKDPHIKTFSNPASPKFPYTFLNFSHPILKYSLITWITHKRRPQFHRQVTCVGDIFLCFYIGIRFHSVLSLKNEYHNLEGHIPALI